MFDDIEPDWVKNIRQDEADDVRKYQDAASASSNDNLTVPHYIFLCILVVRTLAIFLPRDR
uniref:Uncharacterized protein n=1 Tax=Romanomermis culicivorax TaxID=13658 RepID=A0A915HHJ8_ROMCU